MCGVGCERHQLYRPKLNFEIMDETRLLMHWAQSPDENTPSREREVTVHATGTGSFAVSARWLAKLLPTGHW